MNERFKQSGQESAILIPIRRMDKHKKNYPWSQVEKALRKPSKPWDPRISRPHHDQPHHKTRHPNHRQQKIKKVLASLKKFGYPTERIYGQGEGGKLDTLIRRLENRIKDPSQKTKTEKGKPFIKVIDSQGNDLGHQPFIDLAKGLEQRYVERKKRLTEERNKIRKLESQINDARRKLYRQNRRFLKTSGLLANVIKTRIKLIVSKLQKDIKAKLLAFDNNPTIRLLKKDNDSLTDLPIQLTLPISDVFGIKSNLNQILSIQPDNQNEGIFLDSFLTKRGGSGKSQVELLAQSLFPHIKTKDLRFFYPVSQKTANEERFTPIEQRLESLNNEDKFKTNAQTNKEVFEKFEKGFEEVPIVIVKDRVGNTLIELTFSYISDQKLGLINLRMPEQRNKTELLRRVNSWIEKSS